MPTRRPCRQRHARSSDASSCWLCDDVQRQEGEHGFCLAMKHAHRRAARHRTLHPAASHAYAEALVLVVAM